VLNTVDEGLPGTPGIPGDPGGHAGSGASGIVVPGENAVVHVHPGVLGDTDLAGGASELDPRIHRSLNPVARVVLRLP